MGVEEWIRVHVRTVGTIEAVHERPWATVLRVPTDGGVAWCKACAAAQAFERLYFLERACQAQILALSTGGSLHLVPQPVVDATAAQFRECVTVGGVGRSELHFAGLKRLLDRSEPDYAR